VLGIITIHLLSQAEAGVLIWQMQQVEFRDKRTFLEFTSFIDDLHFCRVMFFDENV